MALKRLNGQPFEYQFLRAKQMVPGNRFGGIDGVDSDELRGASGKWVFLGGHRFREACKDDRGIIGIVSRYPLDELVGICLDGETR